MRAFARWLAGKAARNVSLPTKAQWEFACRAGTTSRFYAGDSETDLQAIGWYRDNSGKSAQPVGQKRPNAFGLYDMSGNVYEWCRDWYGPYGDDASDPEETRSDRTAPPRRGTARRIVAEGRAAVPLGRALRNTPASRNADNGFRVAAEAAPVAERPETDATSPPPAGAEQARAEFGTLIFLIVLAGIAVMVFRALQAAGSASGPLQQGPPPDKPRTPSWLSTGMAAGAMLHHRRPPTVSGSTPGGSPAAA